MKINKPAEKIASNLFGRLLASGWVKVPPGFKLVPIEPIPEQILAGGDYCDGYENDRSEQAIEVYRAMVEAAPDATAVLNGQI